MNTNMNQMQSKDEEASDAMKVIFNYNNIFFSFFYDDATVCTHR